jgi:hypothetical protein
MSSAGTLVNDIGGQYVFEAGARRRGIRLARAFRVGRLRYRFVLDVPVYEEERAVRLEFSDMPHPSVYIDGPPCLRHRWKGDSLCMWDPSASPSERWVLADGFPDLADHIRLHAYCEAKCRDGYPWQKPAMAGDHPRKRHCPSCRGRGK